MFKPGDLVRLKADRDRQMSVLAGVESLALVTRTMQSDSGDPLLRIEWFYTPVDSVGRYQDDGDFFADVFESAGDVYTAADLTRAQALVGKRVQVLTTPPLYSRDMVGELGEVVSVGPLAGIMVRIDDDLAVLAASVVLAPGESMVDNEPAEVVQLTSTTTTKGNDMLNFSLVTVQDRLHQYADDHDLDESFDDLLEELGFEGRSFDVTVTIEFTATVRGPRDQEVIESAMRVPALSDLLGTAYDGQGITVIVEDDAQVSVELP